MASPCPGSLFLWARGGAYTFREDTFMSILELFLIAVGLSMDAFAVSVCKGLATQQLRWRHYLIIGAWFGGFQALMPSIGYFLGSTFEKYIVAYDHWADRKSTRLNSSHQI